MIIDKICKHCGESFVAQKTSTSFCSHTCASRAYKKRKREEKIALLKEQELNLVADNSADSSIANKEYLSPTECAKLLGIGRSTVYRYLRNNELKCVQFSGKTLIRKADINQLFDNPTSYKTRPLSSAKPITEFYTVAEIKEKFKLKESWIFKIVREKEIPKVLKRGKTYFSKKHIDKAFAYRKSDDDVASWYSVEHIKKKYGMNESSIYGFVSMNAIRKKRVGRTSYYSKLDFDKAKGVNANKEYYTVLEAMEKYDLTRDTLYYYVSYHKIPKLKEGKYIKISKTELDKIFEKVIL